MSRSRWLSVLVAALVLTAGCTQFSGPEKQLSVAVSDASTAVTTSQLGLTQYGRHRTTAAVASTTLTDMMAQVDKAAQSAGLISVTTRKQTALRTRALADIGAAKQAILDAQTVIDRIPGSPSIGEAKRSLSQASDSLETLSNKLPEPR